MVDDGTPGTKRGLIVRSCEHSMLFQARARRWQYNYGLGLTQFGHDEWLADRACQALRASFEFVPMVYSLGALASAKKLVAHQNHNMRALSKHLLGMNEPRDGNANQSALAVASRWKEVEGIADRFHPPLLLGTPAPGGLELEKGARWLHDFFKHCGALHGKRGCRVDFVAVHFYECDGRNAAAAEASASALDHFLDSTFRAFGRPIWLTEFNCGDGAAPQPLANQSSQNHLRFLRAALPRLEAARHVHKYSWFQAAQRHTAMHPGANPGCSLINANGSALSELGQFYNSFELS